MMTVVTGPLFSTRTGDFAGRLFEADETGLRRAMGISSFSLNSNIVYIYVQC
jgi:hypothetical protein